MSCCGANPGMVSWFVKRALLTIATDVGLKFKEPKTREEWARLAKKAGIKGIHIAERDTQRAKHPKPMNVFVNTWSVEGFISEACSRRNSAGARTRNGFRQTQAGIRPAAAAAIYLLQPGANTRVRSWTPTARAQLGFLVTHNESISIADYFTLRKGRKTIYRPTCHYAYHPCNDAVLSLHEVFGRAGAPQEDVHILDEHEIADGIDELGVLLYGHAKECLLVWLAAVDRRNARGRAISERHRLAGHFGGPRRNGLGAREPEGRHRRDRRDGFPPLPRSADALSRPCHRHLHGLDTSHRPSRTFPGRHRQARPMAVPERADALNRQTEQTQTGGSQGRRFHFRAFASPLLFFFLAWLRRRLLRRRPQAEAVLVRAHPVAVDLAAAVRAVAAAVELAAAGRAVAAAAAPAAVAPGVVVAAVEALAAVVAAPGVVAAAEVLAAVKPAVELAARYSVVAAEGHRAGRRAQSARDVPVACPAGGWGGCTCRCCGGVAPGGGDGGAGGDACGGVGRTMFGCCGGGPPGATRSRRSSR